MFALLRGLTYLLETGNSQGLKGVDIVNYEVHAFFVPKRICPFPDEDNKAQKRIVYGRIKNED